MAATDDVMMEGIFPDRTLADKTAGELASAGVRPEQIEIVPFDGTRTSPPETPPRLLARGGAMLGGIVGACIGCLVGIWLGPGFNRSIHDFALADFLATVVGIVVLGVLGSLCGWAIEGSWRSFYLQDLHASRFAVKIHGAGGNLSEALEIMRRNRGDVFERRVVETAGENGSVRAIGTAEPAAGGRLGAEETRHA